MKRKWCKECGTETLQNPLRRAKATDEQLYRCVQCGFPKRTGGMSKNTLRIGGKIMCLIGGAA